MGHKKPDKIDISKALTGAPPGSDDGDDIEIVEVVGGEPEEMPSPPSSEMAVPGPQAGDAAGETQRVEADTLSAELLERLKRVQAEYENYRKRVERDRVEHREQANARFALVVLPVLDSFERALAQNANASSGEFRTGVSLIYRQLQEAMLKAGLEPLEAKGEMFDPEIHEAAAATPDPNAKPGQVLEVFERGYRFRGRLLRPARVRVAAAEQRDEAGAPSGEKEGKLAH
ncbi:MAG: nucleotide exchange factor GrpE [Acidobacteriota bacterium]